MTDVWTSCGVIAGVALVRVDRWLRIDPLIAIAVGLHISWEGWGLLRESVDGLMDRSLDASSVARAQAVLDGYLPRGGLSGAADTRAGPPPSFRVVVLVPGIGPSWRVTRSSTRSRWPF